MCIASVTSKLSSANGSACASLTSNGPSPAAGRAVRNMPGRQIGAEHQARDARGPQHAEVEAVAAPDVEDRLVAAQLGEIERAVPDVDDRALERVDRLARREVAVVAVLLLDVVADSVPSSSLTAADRLR